MSKVRNLPDPEDTAWVESHGGALLLNTPLHCNKQSLCPACFLAQINEFEYCPIHCPAQFSSDHLAHIVCCQDDNVDRLAILGCFAAFSEHAKFWVFMSFRGMTVLELLGTPILLRYHWKLASRLHAQIVPLLNLQKLVPFSLIIFLTSGLMMTHGIS